MTRVPFTNFYTFVKMVTMSLSVSVVLSTWNYNGNMIWGCFCRCFVLVVCGVSEAGYGVIIIACNLEIIIFSCFLAVFPKSLKERYQWI